MGARKLEEDILLALPSLPDEGLAQVYSLIEKIKDDKKSAYLKAIEEGPLLFKGAFSSLDEFMKNKQLEREAENK